MPPVPRAAEGAAQGVATHTRQARAVTARQVPYGERPARNRQLTLLAELLGTDWRQAVPARFGVGIGDLNRRQAAAAIRQLTGGVRPTHVARGTWHRVAVDPDWIERPRGTRRMASAQDQTGNAMAHPVGEPVLPIQVKALRLLGDRLGMDVATAAPTRFGCDLGHLDRRTAAAWIAELTHLVLVSPAVAAGR
ncbi:MAG: hypothetical protein OXG64_06500 [Chloroflexi bacterium]|nr:hypothetical protein [Chloroflexota bacterium]